MHMKRSIALLLVPATLAALAAPAAGQGKGKGKGSEKAHGQSNAHAKVESHGAQAKVKADVSGNAFVQKPGRGHAKQDEHAAVKHEDKVTGRANAVAKKEEHESRGEVVRMFPPVAMPAAAARTMFVHPLVVDDVRPIARRYVISTRPPERVAGHAVAYALARGVPENALVIVPVSNRVLVRNRTGVALLDFDEARARDLGAWEVVPLDNTIKEGAPSFCRSGAGHPVWGRQWCLDKGFGLGSENNIRWGRTRNPADIVFRPVTQPSLTEVVLRSVLGDRAVDRLAVHALTLGLVDPLVGRWLGEPTGSGTLLVTSGGTPVAELVDTNRDNRVDDMLVALKPW